MRQVFPLLLLLAAGPAAAGTPSMLLDINSTGVQTEDDAGVAGSFLPLGRVALVLVDEPTSGTELWVTDGTDAGTRPLFDWCPGSCSGAGILLGAVGNVGFFGRAENGNAALWRSDGTLPGTFPLVAGKTACRQRTAQIGRTLFLSMGDPSDEFYVCELWKTDGTAAGTARMSETDPIELTTTSDRIFFAGVSPEGGALWTSDGTPEGTVRLHEWPAAVPTHLLAVGGRLFFIAPEDGLELWTSDGTPGGTRPVTRFAPATPFIPRFDFSGVYVVQALDDRLVFLANDGTAGREVWTSDGTAAGTRPATAFAVASPFLGPDKWRAEKLGSRLVFAANDGTSGNRLWTSNGGAGSMAPLSGCPNGCPELAPTAGMARQGGRLAFVGGRDESELWVTDGTGPGTRRLLGTSVENGVSQPIPLLGRIFFVVESNVFDLSLYATDEALGSPRRLTSLDRATTLPVQPVALGELALFALPKFTSGRELWRSDGTPAGTFPVTRIGQTGQSSMPRHLVPAGDAVRFVASTGESGGLWTSRGTAETTTVLSDQGYPGQLASLGSLTLLDVSGSLWRSDGAPAGTFELTSSSGGDGDVTSIAPLTTGRAVIGMRQYGLGLSIWATDGNVAGTQKIFDVPAEFAFLSEIVAVGQEAFFVTTMSSHDDRLWVTDGTVAGTRPVTGSRPRFIQSPLRVARFGAAFFFAGDDNQNGVELWRSDGTAAGTHILAEGRAEHPEAFLEHQGHLYFFASLVGPPYGELGLWQSDGTETGTILLHSWSRGDFYRPLELVPFGNLLLFAARDEDGVELWRTDGTAAGTVQVRDVNPGVASSLPWDLEVLGDRLYFTAHDKNHGNELWESDGTAAGTRLVQDIAPGSESSRPEELTAAGGRLYFSADDGVHGREPWVYAPGGTACVASETVLCLRGGRFKVEADWRTEGSSSQGRAVSLTADTGYFWFFDPSNVEVILKVLDGQGLNGHHWVFYGALSNVEYALTVTDTQTGAARRYTNLPGRLGSVADTQAFGPLGAHAPGVVTAGPAPSPQQTLGEAIVTARTTEATASCTPSATRLCLNGGRFAVEARWKAQGQNGTGKAVPLTGGDTGYFWFFDESNVEVVLKVLDGTSLNGKFWVFYGALSDVEYTLTVTDTVTGAVKTYTNPGGRLASVADTGAF